MQRFTDHTVTDPVVLLTSLDAVRQCGYATAVDEFEVGLTAVAAPITGPDGIVVASLSAFGPSFRISGDRVTVLADLVTTAAREASRRLGWQG